MNDNLSSTQDEAQTEDSQTEDANGDMNEGTASEVMIARENQVRNALAALNEAEIQINNLSAAVQSIRKMLPDASSAAIEGVESIDVSFVPFSHVGKEIRNKLMADLYKNLESVEDSIKATWRSVKNVKRSRLTEEQIDRLIIGSRRI